MAASGASSTTCIRDGRAMTDTPQPPAEADIARCRVGVRQNTMSSVENRRTMEAKLNELKS